MMDIVNNCGYDFVGSYLTKDFSSINYCVDSYVFTKWVTENLDNIQAQDLVADPGEYDNVEDDKYIFVINDDNNPDPEATADYQSSLLAIHKKDVIINKLEKNLGRAVEVANNQAYDYRLPKLTYSEWEQALSNISAVTFMQGMQIGLKYYNNYAIATSTLNREYVDPQELYFSGTGDEYYHQRTCDKVTGSSYVGYRSVDYIDKSYNNGTEDKHYYLHDNKWNINSELECYSCLVNASTYKKHDNSSGAYIPLETSYYNALARERYIQLNTPTTASVQLSEIILGKHVYDSAGNEIDNDQITPGKVVTYKITLENRGPADDVIYMIDYFPWYDTGSISKIEKLSTLEQIYNSITVEGSRKK